MRIRPRALLPALTLLAAVALALAGCQSSYSSGDQSSGYGADAGAGAASNPEQTLAFASPADGAQVASPVKVSFKLSGAELGKAETGKMHLHVYVDDSTQYKILWSSQGSVDVPEGSHTLKAVLAQPNHSETAVTATEQVEVTAGAGQATATTADDGYDYSGSGSDSSSSDGGGYGYP
jgi:hypothetical protein